MEKIIQDVFGEEGIISEMFEGYKVRESQLEAIPVLWNAFKDNKHCFIEGPCGFGKTYAYLFPALMECAEKGKKVVITTSGITLQDQLIKKDVPFMVNIVEKVTGRNLSFSNLKGKNNYICKRACKELEYISKNSALTGDEFEIVNLSNSSKTGDIDELGYIPNYNVWKELSCQNKTGAECKGCPYVCFHQQARDKALNNNIVVTNYHLLMSDIQANGSILGGYDILVCDEGHEIPNIIRDCFEKEFSNGVVNDMKEKLDRLSPYGDLIDLNTLDIDMKQLTSNTKHMFKTIASSFSSSRFGVMKNLKEFDLTKYTSELKDVAEALAELSKDVNNEHSIITNAIESGECYYLNEQERSIMLSEINGLADLAVGSYQFIMSKVAVLNHNFDNDVVFIEHTNKGVTSFKSRMKKVDRIFYENFIKKENMGGNNISILLTSATLSVGGTFDYIKEQLGFYSDIETVEFIGKSPFNLEEQELWYLPSDAVEANKKGFEEVMLRNFLNVCKSSGGGVLGLFTSVYNMNKAFDYLTSNLKKSDNIIVHKQGEYSRSNLIETMRQKNNVVIVGTKSFFTGVDVVGNHLRVVFIDKFPFPNISDPVVKELCNEPGGFFKFSIPEMVISLKQAVGRGVRSIDDKCVICINDNRLATARYKVQVNKSFGYKKKATRDLDDVELFLEEEF